MALALPLRIASLMRTGVPSTRTVRRVVRRNGKRRVLTRRVTILKAVSYTHLTLPTICSV